MIKCNTTLTLNLKDAKQIISHLHDSCQISVTFSSDDDVSGRAILHAHSIIGSVTDAQLDAEEKTEIDEFKKNHPEICNDKSECSGVDFIDHVFQSLPSDEELDEDYNEHHMSSFADKLPTEEMLDAADDLDLATYKSQHPKIM